MGRASSLDNKAARIFGATIMIALSVLPLIGVMAPRFMAFSPPLIGALGMIAYYPVMGQRPQFCKAAWLIAGGIMIMMGLSFLWAYAPDMVEKRVPKTALLLIGMAALVSLLQSLKPQQLNLFRHIFPPVVVVSGIVLVIDLYSFGGVYKILHADLSPESLVEFNLSHLNRNVVIFSFSALMALFIRFPDLKTGKKSRIYTALLMALLILIFLGKDSQSAQLSLLFAGGIFMLYPLFPVKHIFFWRLIQAAFITLLMATPWLTQWAFAWVATAASENTWLSQGYAAHRMEIWDYISRYALQKPVLGYGVEATQAIKDFDSPLLYTPINYVLHPHNFAVQLWIEFGATGAALGGALLCILTEKFRTLPPYPARVAFTVLMTALLVFAISHGMWQGWWLGLLSFLLGLLVILQKTIDQKTGKPL